MLNGGKAPIPLASLKTISMTPTVLRFEIPLRSDLALGGGKDFPDNRALEMGGNVVLGLERMMTVGLNTSRLFRSNLVLSNSHQCV